MSAYRYCIHCQADTWNDFGHDDAYAGHTMGCPFRTGVHPVTVEGACLACRDPFQDGDHYVLINDEVTCLGCGARELIL